MTYWNEDFPLETQRDAEGLRKDEPDMACGLSCLRMIERWATDQKEPTRYRTWLNRIEPGQKKTRYLDHGVEWNNLIKTGREHLDRCTTWGKKISGDSIPTHLTDDQTVILVLQKDFFWPTKKGWRLKDLQHYAVVTQLQEVKLNRKPTLMVCIADPVRTYLSFERWSDYQPLVKEAVPVTRGRNRVEA
jgi:hypothetical protein